MFGSFAGLAVWDGALAMQSIPESGGLGYSVRFFDSGAFLAEGGLWRMRLDGTIPDPPFPAEIFTRSAHAKQFFLPESRVNER